MSTENTSKKHARSEDNPIITEDIITENIVTEDIIEVENIIEIEKLIPADDIAGKKNAFEELLINKKNSDLLNLQIKNKGKIKTPQLESGENCNTKIETSGSTGNIISHFGRRHKIYKHSKPPSSTPSIKQVKINNYTISSDSISQMTPNRQKYLETLLFEWLVLDFQPLYLLKSPSFHQFINALNENFKLLNDKKFQKRIFDAYEFSQKQLKQYIYENSSSVSLTCVIWTSRSKQRFLGVTCHLITPDFEMKEITLAIKYMPYPYTGDAIQKELEKIISEWELQDKERLIILKPYIDIVISSLNVSKDRNVKNNAKRLIKINLTDDEWNTIRDLLEILGSFAELTEKLEGTKYVTMSYIYPGIARLKKRFRPIIEFNNNNLDLETNDDAFEDHQFEEVDEDDEPEARQKIKINTPVNTSNLLNNIKVNLYKALEKYYEIIEKEALVATLLDPRKKKMKFADENKKEFAKNSLYEVYELAKNDTNVQQESHKPEPKKRKLSKEYVYKESLFSDDEYDDTQTEDNEIKRYLVMAQIQSDQDPLKWWDINKVQYPILAHMIQKYLSIQTMSGASERVFSDARLIMSVKRMRMKEDLFEALIFLKRNGNLVGGMFNNDT
ncbi:zinc finger BED domain-containing protein 1-like [Rhizophagus clarus]|uniref:Zinc finger BED domain-containing protein 1-like n=1 Tax=Rhizophagus clarus TaxID=94130 RepID=A0A8H3R3H3_9GLOM|nr:zinc finger BED domain-containing protein 1-like [Rhizophagus clarus]